MFNVVSPSNDSGYHSDNPKSTLDERLRERPDEIPSSYTFRYPHQVTCLYDQGECTCEQDPQDVLREALEDELWRARVEEETLADKLFEQLPSGGFVAPVEQASQARAPSSATEARQRRRRKQIQTGFADPAFWYCENHTDAEVEKCVCTKRATFTSLSTADPIFLILENGDGVMSVTVSDGGVPPSHCAHAPAAQAARDAPTATIATPTTDHFDVPAPTMAATTAAAAATVPPLGDAFSPALDVKNDPLAAAAVAHPAPNNNNAMPTLSASDAPFAVSAAAGASPPPLQLQPQPLLPPLTADDTLAHAAPLSPAPAPAYPMARPPQQQLEAFARLRFLDGSYYMHTYSIILGRNVYLAHDDMKRLMKAERLRKQGNVRAADAVLMRNEKKRKRKGKDHARSVLSESGGIVNAPLSTMPQEFQQRRQSAHSQSHSSASHPQGGESSQDEPAARVNHAPPEVLMQAFQDVPEQLDRFAVENPNDCPLVPIHPQQVLEQTGVRGPKGISREHAKIQYNFERGGFDLEVLSSNGVYLEAQLYKQGEVVELNHGDTIMIGMVEMVFYLPDVALTEEQRAREESNAHPPSYMSFQFENERGEPEMEEAMSDESASEHASINPRHTYYMPVGSDLDSDDEARGDDEEEDDDDDDPPTPQPRHKKQPRLNLINNSQKSKYKQKQKHKHKQKQRPIPTPHVQKKPEKRGPYKRKSMAHDDDDDDEEEEEQVEVRPPAKKAKKTPLKEPQISPPVEKSKEKGKAPAKEPPKERPEPTTTAPSASPAQPRLSTAEGSAPAENDLRNGQIITTELAKKYGLPDSVVGQVLESRKGPGRPPKDGLISKRARAQLIRQGKAFDQAKAAGIDPADIPVPVKAKAPSKRKDSNAHATGAEGDDENVVETTEGGDGTTASALATQSKTPARPPRTPSPEMRIEDYTEEQLQRPSANYVVLIHEAISSSPSGQLNLQQIYSYIERKYPWYKFKTTTSGWQSSIRHNLGQHEAFVKGDKEGKGYNWRLNKNVSIEKERRKRQATPPQLGHQQRPGYYPPQNGYAPYGHAHPGPYYPGMPPQGMPPNGPAPPPAAPAEPLVRRLPPSLSRSAAAVPAVPAASPYASPWAGGNAAGSPGTQQPPRPYPPASSQPPPASAAHTASGQYGMLMPTSGPPVSYPSSSYGGYTTASAYGNQYATAGASPYSAPQRPYTPYATGLPAPNAESHGAANPHPHPQPHGLPQSQATPSNSTRPHGMYPPSTRPDLIELLENFRSAYTERMPGQDQKTIVDRAIQAYVRPERVPSLTSLETQLLGTITKMVSPNMVQESGTSAVAKAEASSEAKVNGSEKTDKEEAKMPEQAQTAVSSTAAVIAANDAAAAVSASNIPSNGVGASTSPPRPKASSPPTETDFTPKTTTPMPHKFTPNMTGAGPGPSAPIPTPTPATAMMAAAITATATASSSANPSPVNPRLNRPSVEPLTPLPNSLPDSPAAVPMNGAGVRMPGVGVDGGAKEGEGKSDGA